MIIVLFVRERKPQMKESRATDSAAGASSAADVAGEEKDAEVPGIPGIDRPLLVCDAMNARPAMLSERSTVREAIEVFRSTETSGLPVVDDGGSIVGFVADGDILKLPSRRESSRREGEDYLILLEDESVGEKLERAFGLRVMDVATKQVVRIEATETAEVAFRMLSERRIKKVPVLSDGKIVGTLSRRNIMRALDVLEKSHRKR